MKKIQKWTRLTGRRKFWIKNAIMTIVRLAIKMIVAYGYTRMFDMMGVYGGIWIKILSWVTAYWLASKLSAFVAWLFAPDEVRHDPDFKKDDLMFSEVIEFIDDMKQLLFYTTDEDRPS